MQNGEYISHRLMIEIIRDICAERGIAFRILSDDWIVEMTKGGVTKRAIGYMFSLNDAVAASIAKDKVATHVLLEEADVPSVPHALLRTKVSERQKQAIEKWDKIIVKPLEGTGGHNVKLVRGVEEAVDWIESTEITAWAAAPFVDIKREIRCILLDQKPLVVFEKAAVMIDGLKMFNLGQGAIPKDIVPTTELLELAARGQAALGLRLSAVDIIETMNGDYQILEINGGFMMEHYARYSLENRNRVVEAYNKIVSAVMNE